MNRWRQIYKIHASTCIWRNSEKGNPIHLATYAIESRFLSSEDGGGGVLELFGNFTMWIYDPEVWIFQGGSIGPFLSRTPDSLLNLRMGNCLESFAIINSIKSVISCYQCPLCAKHAKPESTGNFIYVIKPFKNVGLPRK